MKKTIKKYKSHKSNKQKLTLNKKSKDLIINYNNEMKGGAENSNLKNFITILNELSSIMKNKGEHFRSIAYIKATNELNKYVKLSENKTINSSNDLKSLKLQGIGKTILEKFDEFLKSGTLEALEKEKNNPINIFANIYGIGPKKAEELVKTKNITSLEQLKERQDELQGNKLPLLNKKQKIGLKYYEDLLKRIPREEIEEFKILLESNFKETITENNESQNDHKFEIVGSYRRNKQDSGDIDLIFTSNNKSKLIFNKFIEKLNSKNILLELLSKGEVKSLTIGKLLSDQLKAFSNLSTSFFFFLNVFFSFCTVQKSKIRFGSLSKSAIIWILPHNSRHVSMTTNWYQ